MAELSQLEPWLTKQEIAEHFGFSVRTWERKTGGLRPTEIFGRPRYRVSEAESWLETNGLLKRRDAA